MFYDYNRMLHPDNAMATAKALIEIQSEVGEQADGVFRFARSSVEPPERFTLDVLPATKSRVALKNSLADSRLRNNPIGELETLRHCMEHFRAPLPASIVSVEATKESKHSSYDQNGVLALTLSVTAEETGTQQAVETLKALSGYADIRYSNPRIVLGFGRLDVLQALVEPTKTLLQSSMLPEVIYSGVEAVPRP